MSELKCCKICGAFLTCDRKGECCPECQYFDESDMLCLAPDALKKQIKKTKAVSEEIDDLEEEVDPETFLFEDDDEEDEELISDSDDEDEDDDDDDMDDDDFEIEDVEW